MLRAALLMICCLEVVNQHRSDNPRGVDFLILSINELVLDGRSRPHDATPDGILEFVVDLPFPDEIDFDTDRIFVPEPKVVCYIGTKKVSVFNIVADVHSVHREFVVRMDFEGSVAFDHIGSANWAPAEARLDRVANACVAPVHPGAVENQALSKDGSRF